MDVEYLIKKGLFSKFTSFSFTILILEKLSKLPRSRDFILQALEKVYAKINFDVLENVDLEELSTELPKMLPTSSAATLTHKDSFDFFNDSPTESPSKHVDHFDENIRRSVSNIGSLAFNRRSRYSLTPEKTKNVRTKPRSHERPKRVERFNKVKHRCNSREREMYFKLFIDNVKHAPTSVKKSRSRPVDPVKVFDYCKDVLTQILRGLFSNYKLIPIEIRILCRFLYETLLKHK